MSGLEVLSYKMPDMEPLFNSLDVRQAQVGGCECVWGVRDKHMGKHMCVRACVCVCVCLSAGLCVAFVNV